MLRLRQEIRSVKQSNHGLEDRLQELNRDVEERDSKIKELQDLQLEAGQSGSNSRPSNMDLLNDEELVKMTEYTQMRNLAEARLVENAELNK